ncbi:restriction endonuclease subunit S (plasmid) [Priestia megaterium NCT-2]|uniref:restriction endonuclease subunit S n=1 Tax=Priestia megaterium TaxID=1404 RepID=UPI0003496622|nr:restriction endonuclease subunit S [Priestia megaterium]AYE53519.1 restriction endonuclease subunit S [Priestia megaterium NCT-2]
MGSKVFLKDLVDFQKGYVFKSKDFSTKGIPVIKVKSFSDDTVDMKSCDMLPISFFEDYSKYRLEKGDILIATVGSWPTNPNSVVGRVVRVPPVNKALLNQNIVKIFSNKEKLDNTFLYYLLKTKDFKDYIISTAQGSANQASITLEAIKNYEFVLPPTHLQRKIIEVLQPIDEKIKNNLKIIENLELISQTLFKQWFIDFDFPNEQGHPYKSSGGKMVESELGERPKGWDISLLSEDVNFLSGGTPKTKEESYWNGQIPFFTPKDVKNNLYTTITEKYITELGLSKCNSKLYPKNTLFITARGTVGKVALANIPMAMNQSCFALQHKEDYQFYLYGVVNHLVREIILGANGAVFNAINLKDLNRLKYVKAPELLIKKYQELVSNIYEKMSTLEEEILNLQQLRDTLLPKLLTGEIQITDELVVG